MLLRPRYWGWSYQRSPHHQKTKVWNSSNKEGIEVQSLWSFVAFLSQFNRVRLKRGSCTTTCRYNIKRKQWIGVIISYRLTVTALAIYWFWLVNSVDIIKRLWQYSKKLTQVIKSDLDAWEILGNFGTHNVSPIIPIGTQSK